MGGASESGETGAIIITGTTAGMEVGLDAYLWQVGPSFRGLREVEAGLHLVVMAPSSRVGRQGVWVRLEPGGVAIKEWSRREEGIALGGASPALEAGSLEAARLAARSMPGLGRYPEGHAALWRRLSGHVTTTTLERCGLRLDATFSCEDEAVVDDDDFDGGASRPCPQFTPIPRAASRGDPAAVTRDHLDASERARRLVRTTFRHNAELLGELELAFVVFAALGSLAALRQWRRLLALLAECDELASEAPELFAALADVLAAQLSLAPDDFFEDPLSSAEDAIRPALANLFETLPDSLVAPLYGYVEARFALYGTDLADARNRRLFDAARAPDDAPVLVIDRDRADADADADDDDAARLLRLGFPSLATHLDPAKEDAAMAAARVLDQGPPDARADAVRYLSGLAAGRGRARGPYGLASPG